MNTMGTTLNNYKGNIVHDLDNDNLNILIKLSDKNQYSGCTDAEFLLDSWVPTTSGQTYVPCLISGGAAITSANCGTFSTGATCTGCMDTFSLFDTTNTTSAQVQTALTGRYTNIGDCGTFGTDMGNTWENYYVVKETALTAVLTRYGTADTSVDAVITDLGTNIPNTFTSVTNQLNTIAPTITDPTYGLIVGLNCLLIGEDLVRVTKVLCTEAFNSFYFLRLILGISSFGILFAMCCSVCAGVRHFKHSETIGKIKLNEAD